MSNQKNEILGSQEVNLFINIVKKNIFHSIDGIFYFYLYVLNVIGGKKTKKFIQVGGENCLILG